MSLPLLISLPLAIAAAITAAITSGGDVPQWSGFRGNNGSGVSTATGLPEMLDPEQNLIWRVDAPAGYSSPVIAGKDLYLSGSAGTKLVTLCLDAYSGETRWRRELDFDGQRPGANSPASPTPATDGERVFVLFHHIGLVAYDRAGKELWKHPIGPFNIPHGMASSPILCGDMVVLQVDQDGGSYLVAYDKRTGEQRWRTERPEVTHSYATPSVYEPEGGPAQLVVSGSFQVAGYSLSRGEKLWWVDGAAWMSKSVPVIVGKRCVVNSFQASLGDVGMSSFSGTFEQALASHDADKDGKIATSEYGDDGHHTVWFIFDLDGDELLDAREWAFALASNDARGGLFAIDLGGTGDVTSKIAWRYDGRRGLSDVTSPVIVGQTLFMISEGALLTSLDLASGKVIKQERVGDPDDYFASPVYGDGKLYLASLSGLLSVVRAEPEWQTISTHTLTDEKVWSTPALAGHAVYVRSQNALYCFETGD